MSSNQCILNILEYFFTAWTHTNFFLLMFLPWSWLAYYFITPFFYICVILPRLIFTLDMLLVCIFCRWLLYIDHSEGILVCSGRVFVPSLALSKVFLPRVFTIEMTKPLHFLFVDWFLAFRRFLLLSPYGSIYYCLILIDGLLVVVFRIIYWLACPYLKSTIDIYVSIDLDLSAMVNSVRLNDWFCLHEF